MWPFKKKKLEWITENKQVRRTIYFKYKLEPLISFVWQQYVRLLEWPIAKSYHFAERARANDFEWKKDCEFLNISIGDEVIAINKESISKITYEVEDAQK